MIWLNEADKVVVRRKCYKFQCACSFAGWNSHKPDCMANSCNLFNVYCQCWSHSADLDHILWLQSERFIRQPSQDKKTAEVFFSASLLDHFCDCAQGAHRQMFLSFLLAWFFFLKSISVLHFLLTFSHVYPIKWGSTWVRVLYVCVFGDEWWVSVQCCEVLEEVCTCTVGRTTVPLCSIFLLISSVLSPQLPQHSDTEKEIDLHCEIRWDRVPVINNFTSYIQYIHTISNTKLSLWK